MEKIKEDQKQKKDKIRENRRKKERMRENEDFCLILETQTCCV